MAKAKVASSPPETFMFRDDDITCFSLKSGDEKSEVNDWCLVSLEVYIMAVKTGKPVDIDGLTKDKKVKRHWRLEGLGKIEEHDAS